MSILIVNSNGGSGVYTTIQAAIDAAQDGDTIQVEAGATGVYEEQLSVSGLSDLVIEAVEPVTIRLPAGPLVTFADDPVTGEAVYAVVTVTDADSGSAGVTLSGFTIDGDARGDDVPDGAEFVGVAFIDATGAVVNSTITGVRDATLSGAQSGTGILAADTTGDLDNVVVTGTTVEDFQKNGITARGVFLAVSGSIVTGAGATNVIAQNGIQLSSFAGGSITGNTIQGFGYTGALPDAASGILLIDAFFGEITGNTITGATTNGALGVALQNTEGFLITDNAFSTLQIGIQEDIPADPQVLNDYVNNEFTAPATAPNTFTSVGTGYDLVGSNTFAVDRSDAGTSITDVFDGGEGDDAFFGRGAQDFLIGNDGNDTLEGGGGNDLLNGGIGDDSLDGGVSVDAAVYAGDFSDFTVTVAGNGTITIIDDQPGLAGDEGTDTLTAVEVLLFDDQSRYSYFADDDAVTTNEDVAVVINVSANDGDQNNNGVVDVADVPLDLGSVLIEGADLLSNGLVKTVAGEGVYTVIGGGRINFAPVANFSGAATPIFYTIAGTDGVRSLPTQVAVTVTAVNDAPTVTAASAVGVTAAGGSSTTITVTFADIDGLINVGSIGVNDLTVTGPGGAVTVTGFTVAPTGNGTPRTVVYTVAAPGGTWDASDNGVYTVALNANAVLDTGGLGTAANASLASFTVDIDAPVASFRIEAETFTRIQGFVAASRAPASAGAIIEANVAGPSIARYIFTGTDGVYDLDLGYYDENDGVARMEVLVNGFEIDDWLWNQNLGGSDLSPQTLAERAIGDVTLRNGDVIEIRGFRDGGFEKVRTDYLDFTFDRAIEPEPVSFRVEAETFVRVQNFGIASRAPASAGAVLEANGPAPSIARYTFTGADGVYDLDLGYYDENDGVARMEVWVANVRVDNWLWNQNLGGSDLSVQTLTERAIADVALRSGDVIELRGFRAGGAEKVRTDYLDFTFDRELDPVPVAFRVEAEVFTLVQGFVAASRAIASAGAVIEANVAGPSIARYTFTGADGIYDLDLGYYDENDGVARMEILVDGEEIDDWLWNQNLGGADLSPQTLTERTFSGIELESGDVIELRGFRAAGFEKVRTDYLDFTFVSDLPV